MKPQILLAVLLILASCAYTPEEPSEQMLVVDGWIDDGGFPVVMVSLTVPVSTESTDLNDLGQYVARMATVKVSDGENTVVLTGMRDKRYFPPYIYTTGHLRGESGKTYTLDVSYKGLTASATTTIPQKVELDALECVKTESSDTLYSILASFRDDLSEHRRYKVFVMTEKGGETVFSPSFMGLYDNSAFPSSDQQIHIYPATATEGSDMRIHFPGSQTVQVKFCTLDEDAYEYWKSFENVHTLSRNPLFPTTYNLSSNVRGGLGLWAGYGAAFYSVELP